MLLIQSMYNSTCVNWSYKKNVLCFLYLPVPQKIFSSISPRASYSSLPGFKIYPTTLASRNFLFTPQPSDSTPSQGLRLIRCIILFRDTSSLSCLPPASPQVYEIKLCGSMSIWTLVFTF